MNVLMLMLVVFFVALVALAGAAWVFQTPLKEIIDD
jgi:hypothetical protein